MVQYSLADQQAAVASVKIGRTFGQPVPFPPGCLPGGLCGCRLRRDDKPESGFQGRGLMWVDLAEASLNLVADDGGTDAAGNNDSSLGYSGIILQDPHADE